LYKNKNKKTSSSSYNHNTLTTLRASVRGSYKAHFKVSVRNTYYNHDHTRCTYSQCMPRAHLMTFELTGDTCALLLVGAASLVPRPRPDFISQTNKKSGSGQGRG